MLRSLSFITNLDLTLPAYANKFQLCCELVLANMFPIQDACTHESMQHHSQTNWRLLLRSFPECLQHCLLMHSAFWSPQPCQWSSTHVTIDRCSGLLGAACHQCNDSECLVVCAGTAAMAKANAKQLVCVCCKSATRRAAILLQGCASGTLATLTPALAAQHVCMMHLAQ